MGISGFLLDHDKWSFLYSISFKEVPSIVYKSDRKLFNSYIVDKDDSKHIIVGSNRGICESYDGAQSFRKMLDIQTLALKKDESGIYAATSNGLYFYYKGRWDRVALEGKYLTSLAISDDKILTVIDKKQLVLIDKKNFKVIKKIRVKIDKKELQEDIKLSRFVRDLHYGRGLFDGDISLLINDCGGLVMSFLAISGFVIWYMIRKKRYAKYTKKLIKYHANLFVIIAFMPIFILSVTGVFLDHSSSLAKFMKSVNISHEILPPVYSTLESDIWSVDIDGKTIRIGNRYGVYKSDDTKNWKLENRGFAYKLIRDGELLYVSSMGAENRIYDGKWKVLKDTPHMFKSVIKTEDKVKYFSPHNYDFILPQFKDATLYSLLLTLHDGTFFSSWWVWINDYAAFTLLILTITGTSRWYRKIKV